MDESVCREGTANTISPVTTQVGVFAAACVARDLSESAPTAVDLTSGDVAFKVMFDGCGVTNGTSGVLFASGLREQAEFAVGRVDMLLERFETVVVNVLGLSRGGIGAIFFAQALATYAHAARVELNLLLFDPVPGDQVFSGFPYTGSYAKDLSDCACLGRVLALYPHEPLPEIAFHAPVLCKYPATAVVEEDVTLGCHQAALYATGPQTHRPRWAASNLSFRRIVDFLEPLGTEFKLFGHFDYRPSHADCLRICADALQQTDYPTKRKLHDGLGQGRRVVRRTAGTYLNKHHEQLLLRLHPRQVLEDHGEHKNRNDDGATHPPPEDHLPPPSLAPKYMLDIERKTPSWTIFPSPFSSSSTSTTKITTA